MTDFSKPPEAVWHPIRDLPPETGQWGQPHCRSLVEQWRAVCQRLILDGRDRMHRTVPTAASRSTATTSHHSRTNRPTLVGPETGGCGHPKYVPS